MYAFAGLLVLGVLAMTTHDAIFRWLSLRLVQQQLPGLEVAVDGRFDVTHFDPLTLDVSEVSIRFKGMEPEHTHSRLGDVHLAIDLWPLLRGVVHIERLMVADADIEIPPLRAATPSKPPPTATRLPLIRELLLERVHVRFQLEPGAPPHELNVARLAAGADEDGGLKANGTASLDGDGLELGASFGSVEQFLHPTTPFPVDATLRMPSWGLEARVSGTLAEPLHGSGAELDIQASTSDASPLREVFLPDAPFGGAVDANAHISGDLYAPALSELSLTAEDGDRLHLTISGDVANLRSQEGLDLQVEAASQDPAVTRYLLRDVLAVDVLRFRAGVRGGSGHYRVEDLEAEISGANDLSVGARGGVHLTELEAKWSLRAAQLDLQVAAPVADLHAWLPEAVAKTGTVRGKVHIEGSDQSLVFDNVDLELGQTQPLNGTLKGKLAYTPAQIEAIRTEGRQSANPWVPDDFDLTLDLETGDLKSLTTLLERKLPDLGPVAAKARLRRDGKATQVTKLDARTTGTRPLSLATKGQLTLAGTPPNQRLRDVDLALQAKGANADSVASIVGALPIDPGPWSLQARVKGETGKLQVQALKFESTPNDAMRVELDGTISDLDRLLASAGKSPAGMVLKGHVTAASSDQLGALVGKPVPNWGRLDARFEARGERDDWVIPNASVAINNDSGIQVKATGKASQLLHDARFDANLEVLVPDLKRTVAPVGISLPQLAAITVDGEFKGGRKQVRFDGRIEVGSTPIKTELEVEWAEPRPHIAGTLSTSVLMLGDFVSPAESSSEATGKSPESGPASSPEGEAPDQRLSHKRLRFDLLDQADLELELVADKIEGVRIRTERLELFVDVDNGHLKAHHKELKHEHGTVSSSLEVDNTVDPPKVAFRGRGNNISLGALHAQVSDNPRLLEGLFSFDVDVAGRGHAPHEIFATTNGRYGHVMEDAKLTGRDLDILAFDFLELLTTTVVSKDHTTIDCAIAKFEVNDGIATSDTLYLHTPKMLATGVGKLDFRQDTLDVVVNTKAKGKLISKRLVLRVHGPMQRPKVSTDLSPEAIAAAVAGIGKAGVLALPTLGFSMVGLPFLGGFLHDSEKSPCIQDDASQTTDQP